MTPIQKSFWDFIYEREMMRLRKEGKCYSATLPAGWLSKDGILRRFHFCNVNREDDRVTKWIHENVRCKYKHGTLAFMVVQLLISRIFNDPNTLEEILPFTTTSRLRSDLRKADKKHGKLLRGAYLMVPHGEGETVESYFVPAIAAAHKALTRARISYGNCRSLAAIAALLQNCPGVGPFIANQVCTDLRYVPTPRGRKQWEDWETFILAGPGTRRGLNRYWGRIIRGPGSRQKEENYSAEILRIRKDAPPQWKETFRDPNNLSNCFCEFDKYQRAQDQIDQGETPSLKRTYTPHAKR
jgi:hypothetical protein